MRSFNRQDYVMRQCNEYIRIQKDEHNGIGDKDIHNLEIMMYSIMPRSYWFKRGCISTLRKAIKAMTKKDAWISVKSRLPEEDEYVLIWVDGDCQVARIEKGISIADREKMKNGELPDPCETVWNRSDGYHEVRRSKLYCGADEHGNNLVPYRWKANGGPMEWFGQEVTHWMPLPEGPN